MTEREKLKKFLLTFHFASECDHSQPKGARDLALFNTLDPYQTFYFVEKVSPEFAFP